MKKKFILLFICFFVFTGCEKKNSDVIYTITLDDGTIEKLSYSELKEKVNSNEVNWENNYMNRDVSFTGIVKGIEAYNGDANIEFENGLTAQVDKYSPYYKETSNISIGDTLTCTGTLPSSALFWMLNIKCTKVE